MIRNLLILLFCLPWALYSQNKDFTSIHQEQSDYYSQFAQKDVIFFDSLYGFSERYTNSSTDTCQLNKLVFGFHPYWMGSAYLNYQWNLLSDVCYFSYEINPNSGDPVTLHDWLIDPSVDSAQAHGVRTHLCATLFSGHYAFFGNPVARQNLITNLISLVQQRNADGINIDFEAVPSSLSVDVTSFMLDLSSQYHSIMPDGILSIDLPAIDWGNVFDVNALKEVVDLFFVMGYDYYWNGSGTAGPVGPLYSMTDDFNYSLCRTISEYQAAGIPNEKFILGLPYYGRVWKTLLNTVPSGTIGYGTALTYANVRNNGGGNYSPANYHWEPNSFSSSYIYYVNSDWNQCFIGLERDMRKRYDLVNYRSLAGIGIWALGYDNGYTELWDAIRAKLTGCAETAHADTIYDCGGPAWNYYNKEDYLLTLRPTSPEARFLDFRSFSTEEGFDSLIIFTGTDSLLYYIGGYSGEVDPGILSSDYGSFTLHFRSDNLATEPGWEAIWHDGTLGMHAFEPIGYQLQAYPNPFVDHVEIQLNGKIEGSLSISCYDLLGRRAQLYINSIDKYSPEITEIVLTITSSQYNTAGIYFLEIWDDKGHIGSIKLVSK